MKTDRKLVTEGKAVKALAPVRKWANAREGRRLLLAQKMTQLAGCHFHRQEVGAWLADAPETLPSFGTGLLLLRAFELLRKARK
jgi:hypothetical protein